MKASFLPVTICVMAAIVSIACLAVHVVYSGTNTLATQYILNYIIFATITLAFWALLFSTFSPQRYQSSAIVLVVTSMLTCSVCLFGGVIYSSAGSNAIKSIVSVSAKLDTWNPRSDLAQRAHQIINGQNSVSARGLVKEVQAFPLISQYGVPAIVTVTAIQSATTISPGLKDQVMARGALTQDNVKTLQAALHAHVSMSGSAAMSNMSATLADLSYTAAH